MSAASSAQVSLSERKHYEAYLRKPSQETLGMGRWNAAALEVGNTLGVRKDRKASFDVDSIEAATAFLARCRGTFARFGDVSRDRDAISRVQSTDPQVLFLVGLARGWLDAAVGDTPTVPSPAPIGLERAADVKLDVVLLRAIGSGSDGSSVAQYVKHARRAAQRSRTEGFVEYELLCSLVLARARRVQGRSFLAQTLLSALARSYPTGWATWVEAERSFAGLPTLRANSRLGRTLNGLYRSPSSVRWDELSKLQRFRDEATKLAMMLGSPGPRCHSLPVPFGLSDAYAVDAPADYVLEPGQSGYLRFASARNEETVVNAFANGEQPACGLCALAEAYPSSVPVDAWFERAFARPHRSSEHGEVVRSTLRRMRQLLPDGASIVREGHNLGLRTDESLVFPHPRARTSIEDRVLACIGRGQRSSKEIANELAVSARTVQLALQRLTEDSLCTASKEGRQVRYEVEDTSFFSPTLTRLAHQDGIDSPEGR